MSMTICRMIRVMRSNMTSLFSWCIHVYSLRGCCVQCKSLVLITFCKTSFAASRHQHDSITVCRCLLQWKTNVQSASGELSALEVAAGECCCVIRIGSHYLFNSCFLPLLSSHSARAQNVWHFLLLLKRSLFIWVEAVEIDIQITELFCVSGMYFASTVGILLLSCQNCTRTRAVLCCTLPLTQLFSVLRGTLNLDAAALMVSSSFSTAFIAATISSLFHCLRLVARAMAITSARKTTAPSPPQKLTIPC